MNDKPTVHPVLIAGEEKATARKIRSSAPSMPAGTPVLVERVWGSGQWSRMEIVGVEYATVMVREASGYSSFASDDSADWAGTWISSLIAVSSSALSSVIIWIRSSKAVSTMRML